MVEQVPSKKLTMVADYRGKDGVRAHIVATPLGGDDIVVIEADTVGGDEAEVVLSVAEVESLRDWLTSMLPASALEPAQPLTTLSSPRSALWRHMHDEHGLVLLESELDEIELLAKACSADEPPAARGKWDVMKICGAYESGFGHGAKGDALPNPYIQGSAEFEAYQIGVDAGYAEGKRGVAQPPAIEPSLSEHELVAADPSIETICALGNPLQTRTEKPPASEPPADLCFRAARVIRDYASDAGDDHSAGLCNCDDLTLAEELERAAARAPQPPLNSRGADNETK